MKKKTKIILGLTSTFSIASLVVGASLGCALYRDSTLKTAVNQTKKNNDVSKPTVNLATSDVNTGVNYNDNAYLQTVNQPGTVNPFSGAWTKTTALNYTVKNINDAVSYFGVSSILRWVLIQNLNYNIAQYLQIINANIFSIAVENFNYSIIDATNNDSLTNFSCTIKFSIQFKATCKTDGNSISFTNNYTYNNVKLVPMVMSIGDAGYSYLQLVNRSNNTFVPSQVNYCQNAQISSGWTNKDFEYLLGLDWLPIPSSYSLTTDNYQSALPAECARSFNHGTSQNTIGQTTFVNFVNQYELYTFNIGFKFNGLSKLVIECDNQYNTNNKYEVSPNQTVTLSINTILGTINPLIDSNIKIEWQQQQTINNETTWKSVQSGNTYSFSALSNGVYRAVATFPNGKQTISNTLTINVENDSLLIATNASSYEYGTSCTLYISDNHWANLTGITYQWMQYDETTGDWVKASGISNGVTYTFNVYQNATYELIINDGVGFSVTSNSLAISVINNSVTISASQTNVNYAQNITVSVQTPKWENNPDLIYTWTFTSATSSTSYSVVGKSTFTYDVANDVLCKLTITSKTNQNFKLTSNIVSINVSNNSIILGVNGLSVNDSNVYNLNYGKMAQISIDNSYWNTPSLKNTWTYQWEGYGLTKNDKYEWQIINNPNNDNTLDLNSINGIYSMYQLVLINKNNNLQLTSANVVTINLVNQNATINASWSNQTSNGASTIEVEQGTNVTLTPMDYWGQEQFTNNSSYEYEWYDANTNSLVSHGNTLNISKISKNSSYYLVILNTLDSNFKVTSSIINIEVNLSYPLIQLVGDSSSIGYGQQITLKLQPGNNDFWYSSGITYHWCTFTDGVITPIVQAEGNYYQVVDNPSYTPFIVNKNINYCLQATIGGKSYYSNIVNAGYTNESDNVSITLNGISNSNQILPYYPSTYREASNNVLSIANGSYWLKPNTSPNTKITYQWYSYQINSITGQQENLTKLNSLDNLPYQTSFNQVINGTTYYKLEITEQTQVQTPTGMQTLTIGTPISNEIEVTSSSTPITCTVNNSYGQIASTSNSVYSCQYGSWAQLELASTANPNQQIVYNGCLYQWEAFIGENWVPVTSGTNIDSTTSGTISSNDFAQFSFWVSTYVQYRLHVYLNNPNYNSANAYSSKYSYSIYSSPITFNVSQNVIDISATDLNGVSTSNAKVNANQFGYGTKIKLSIANGWASAYNEYVQYLWQTYDSNAEEWINYDYTTSSFSPNNSTEQTVQGSNNCTFYFTQNGQYRLVVQYWKNNSQGTNSANHPYLAYSLSSNILNLQVDHGNVYINATGTNLTVNKNNNNEYQTPYNSTIDFGIEENDNQPNYYVQNRSQYVFTWTWTMGGMSYSQTYSPTTNQDQFAPSNVNILAYTAITLTITLSKNNPDYYAAFKLVSDNSIYITCEDSSISALCTNNNKTAITSNYANLLTFNIANTDYWYGKTGYEFYWCEVQPDGSWIVLDNGTTTTSGASYSFYASPFDNSNIVNYQLLVVEDASNAFVKDTISINGVSYTHITKINNVFALRSNSLTVTVTNANCNISYSSTTTSANTNGKPLSETINYGSQFTLSFDKSYWDNYSNQTATHVSYQWQANNGSGWENIASATTDSYQANVPNSKIQYRLELTWSWSNSSSSFTAYSYVTTINVANATVSISAKNLTINNQTIENGDSVPFGSQIQLSITPYWQTASTVKSYNWTPVSNNETNTNDSFSTYAIGQQGQVITYTLTIILNDGSTLTATFSIKIIDATCAINPTTLSNNNLVASNNIYTIEYGSLCKFNLSGYWASFYDANGYVFNWSFTNSNGTSSSLATDEFLAQNGTYQLTITNPNWGSSISVKSNIITIKTIDNSFNLGVKANNEGSSITQNNGSYVANYGTSINLKITSGFNPGTIPSGYSIDASYQWLFNYSYEDTTTNSIKYASAKISGATNNNLDIYLLSASSYSLTETYAVKNSSGITVGLVTVNSTNQLNLTPSNVGVCSIKCTNYDINSQGIYSVPYLSSPALQLSGWLSNDTNITNNSSISYVWQNYTNNQSATTTSANYDIEALTSQSQYGLKINIPTITQTIYTNNGLVTKTFSVLSNILTFKIYATTITISPQQSNSITKSTNNTYTLDTGSSATLQLNSNDSSNAYWEGMSDVSWAWYDLGGQLSNNPLTDVNGNSVSDITYNNDSLVLPANVNYITRTYYVVMTYTKNGNSYSITSNEITLVVNDQPPLTTTIDGNSTTINNNQNIQLLFGDQQTISFDYNSLFGVSQADWNPEIFVNGVNVTATKTNTNTKFSIDGNEYSPIAISLSGTTYTFKTYPTPAKQHLSYQVVIGDSSKNPNPCYPLKTVTFNILSIVPKLNVSDQSQFWITGDSPVNSQVFSRFYPYGYALTLVGNLSNPNNINLPTNLSYQWYKIINGVPTAIPNIPTSNNWPVTFTYNGAYGNWSFTPSASSNTQEYNFYVMDGTTGNYEVGITNNGVTLFSSAFAVNMLSPSDYIPSLYNNNFGGYSNSAIPVGTTSDISFNSTNQQMYIGGLNTVVQSSLNGQTYAPMTNNVIEAGQTTYYRAEFSAPNIKQINPFDTAHQIMTFVPQYTNTVVLTAQSITNKAYAMSVSGSQTTSNLTEILPGNDFEFYFTSPFWVDTFQDLAGYVSWNVPDIVALEQLVNGNWTVISYVDQNSYTSGSTSTLYPTFKYHELWVNNPGNNATFGDAVDGGNYFSFTGPTINSYGIYKYRFVAFSANTYLSTQNPTFVAVATSSVVTVDPEVLQNITTEFTIDFSSYTAYYDKDISKYGYTNTLAAYLSYDPSSAVLGCQSSVLTWNGGTQQLPWIAEVGAGTPFSLSYTGMPSWITNNNYEFTTDIEVVNSSGKIIPISDFNFTFTPFTQAQTGASCQDELDAQNSSSSDLGNYYLNPTNTDNYNGSLKFIWQIKAGDSVINALPFTITFPKIQANQSDWSIQQDQNINSTGNNTYSVNANTPINWTCSLPNESKSISGFSYPNNNYFPILSSALNTTGNYTFVVQYYDQQTKQWISYFNPWASNASFLNIAQSTITYYSSSPSAMPLWYYNPNDNNTVAYVSSYYLFPSSNISGNDNNNWVVSSQNLLDTLAYFNYSSLTFEVSQNMLNLTFPSLSSWSVNPFSLNIAKSGKYRIAMAFSLYNYVTPSASQIQNQNLAVYSPVYTFNVNQTTSIKLVSKDNSIISSSNQNGLTFYTLDKNGTYDLSFKSSEIDWNGDGEYNQATMQSEYNATDEYNADCFKSDTVSSDQYAMLWAGPVVILQYSWVYYPLSGGDSTTLESWTNSIKGYNPSATTNNAMFNGIYENASSGQILGLASGSTTQYQPGTGLNSQNVLTDASITLSGDTLKPGVYELAMNILYTSFIGQMVSSSSSSYNWNIFGDNPSDIYNTVTSSPIIILPFTNSTNSNK